MTTEAIEAPEPTPFPPGTLAAQLWAATQAAQRITPAANAPRRLITRVRAVEGGGTRLHAGSRRRAVLSWIESRPGRTASIEEIEGALGAGARGDVQKLIAAGHLEAAQ